MTITAANVEDGMDEWHGGHEPRFDRTQKRTVRRHLS